MILIGEIILFLVNLMIKIMFPDGEEDIKLVS